MAIIRSLYLLLLLNGYCSSNCRIKFQESKDFSSDREFPANTLSECQDRCSKHVLCGAICWNETARLCYISEEKPDTSMTTNDTCKAYEPIKHCDSGCSWLETTYNETYQDNGTYIADYSFDDCKRACKATPLCVALDWSSAGSCYLHTYSGQLSSVRNYMHVKLQSDCPYIRDSTYLKPEPDPVDSPIISGWVFYFFVVLSLTGLVIVATPLYWMKKRIMAKRKQRIKPAVPDRSIECLNADVAGDASDNLSTPDVPMTDDNIDDADNKSNIEMKSEAKKKRSRSSAKSRAKNVNLSPPNAPSFTDADNTSDVEKSETKKRRKSSSRSRSKSVNLSPPNAPSFSDADNTSNVEKSETKKRRKSSPRSRPKSVN